MAIFTKFLANISFSTNKAISGSIYSKTAPLVTKYSFSCTDSLISRSCFHYGAQLSENKSGSSGKIDPDIDLDALKKSPEIQKLLQVPEIVLEFKALLPLLQKHGFNWATARNPLTLLKVMSDSEVRAQLAKIQKMCESQGLKMDISTLKSLMKL